MPRILPRRVNQDEGIPAHQDWLRTASISAKDLIARFPMGIVVADPIDDEWYVLGVNDSGDKIAASTVWPFDSEEAYDRALTLKQWFSPAHFRRAPHRAYGIS